MAPKTKKEEARASGHAKKNNCGDETKCQAVVDNCNRKFLACLFMHGVNEKLHKKCINELNNVCLSGSDWCPKLAEAAMTCMLHHMEKNHGDESREGIQLMQNTTIECWLCQEEGHKKMSGQTVRRKNNWRVNSQKPK